MTVAGLKEANLQHRNEIRLAAFVSDTEQRYKKKTHTKTQTKAVCVVHLWTLNFSAGFESWNGAAKVE